MQAQDKIVDIKTQADWDKVMGQAKPVIVDFYADWCPPCQKLKPMLEKAATDNNDKWILAKVNVDIEDLQELGQKYAASGIPSVYLFHNKELKEGKDRIFRGFNQQKAQKMIETAASL